MTYFYDPLQSKEPASKNVFRTTWKLFTGPQLRKATLDELPHFSYETVHLFTKDSIAIESWYIPVDSAKGTVILVHGLGANKSQLLNQAYEFMYFGFSVMLIDLRGHGASGGNVTTLGYRESEEVKLAFDFVSKKGEKNIMLYGISLGATVIVKAINDYKLQPSRVILEMPFNSQESLFAQRGRLLGFPSEPFGILITSWASLERGYNAFRQKTVYFAENVKCPVLLMYGDRDRIVPETDTRAIFRSLGSRDKRLVRFVNADHDLLLGKDPEEWRTEVSLFLLRGK